MARFLSIILVLPYVILLFGSCSPDQTDISQGEQSDSLDYLELFNSIREKDLDSAKVLAEMALMIGSLKGDSLYSLRAKSAKAHVFERFGEYDSAIWYYEEALGTARNIQNKWRIKFILNRLGIIHADFGNYYLSLKSHLQSLALREQDGDSAEIAVACNNIGLIYLRLADNKQALNYFRRGWAFDEKGENQPTYLLNVGISHLSMEQYDSAFVCLKQAEKFCKKGCSRETEAITFHSLGLYYFKAHEDLGKARSLIHQSIGIGQQGKLPMRIIIGLYNLSRIELKDDRVTLALRYAKESLSHAELYNNEPWIRNNLEQLATIYFKFNLYDSAYIFQKKYDTLNNRLGGDEVRAQMASLEREVEEKEKAFLREKETQALRSRKQLFIGSSVGIVFLSGLAFFYYRSNRFRKKANRQISETLEELHTTQDQLVAQEKMAALGQLVSGIAHEINTPLGAIQGLIQPVNDHFAFVTSQLNQVLKVVSEDHHTLVLELMKHYGAFKSQFTAQERRDQKKSLNMSLTNLGITLSKPTIAHLLDIGVTELHTSWEEILKLPNHETIVKLIHSVVMHEHGTQQMETVVNKIAKMVSALQTYSQPERLAEVKVAIDLRENIDQVLVLLENEFKKGVQLIKNYPKTLTPIQCNPEALSQVWTNLFINAIQAVEGRGTVEVEMEETAEQITVSIKDDGCGIKEEDKDKIFEAFYTTKMRGYGTGLGLNIVRKIVMNHGGKIKLEVETGKTVFRTTFSKTL